MLGFTEVAKLIRKNAFFFKLWNLFFYYVASVVDFAFQQWDSTSQRWTNEFSFFS